MKLASLKTACKNFLTFGLKASPIKVFHFIYAPSEVVRHLQAARFCPISTGYLARQDMTHNRF